MTRREPISVIAIIAGRIWRRLQKCTGRLLAAAPRIKAHIRTQIEAAAEAMQPVGKSPLESPPLQLLTLFDPPAAPPPPLNPVLQEHLVGENGLQATCWTCTLSFDGQTRTFLFQSVVDLTTSPVSIVSQRLDPVRANDLAHPT